MMYKSDSGAAGPKSRATRDPRVLVDNEPIAIRLDLRQHSPSGLSWGYAGSGPAQCALAILADHFNHHPEDASLVPAEERDRFVDEAAAVHRKRKHGKAYNLNADVAALVLYQEFKWAVVSGWPQSGDWHITSEQITRWIESVRQPLIAEAHKAVADAKASDGTEGQDRKSYTDTQDRKNYRVTNATRTA